VGIFLKAINNFRIYGYKGRPIIRSVEIPICPPLIISGPAS
jgi:hypothetical protein